MRPKWSTEYVALWRENAVDVLSSWEHERMQMVVTSPPYYGGLRDYTIKPTLWPAVDYCPLWELDSIHVPEWHGILGREPKLSWYVGHMVYIWRLLRKKALRSDGVCFLNIGDCYMSDGGRVRTKPTNTCNPVSRDRVNTRPSEGHKVKDLMGVPWTVANALKADGWYLRAEIIWHKTNPVPDPCQDRPTRAHEQVFLLSVNEQYYYDHIAVLQPFADARQGQPGGAADRKDNGQGLKQPRSAGTSQDGRNLRDVWSIATQKSAGGHGAAFPERLVARCVKAGSALRSCSKCGAAYLRDIDKEFVPQADIKNPQKHVRAEDQNKMAGVRRGTNIYQTVGWVPQCECNAPDIPSVVGDIFAGSGTTGLVALQYGRRAFLIEASEDYCDRIITPRLDGVKVRLL